MTGSQARPWVRSLARRLHRWIALTLGIWFALLGLTGAFLVWHAEADRALNPQWFARQHRCTAENAAPIATSLAIFARATQGGTATLVTAPTSEDAAFVVWQAPVVEDLRRQHFIDPNCGHYLGWRDWGAVRGDRAHVVPLIYELHRALLSREAGHVAVGFVGLLLLIVAITGALGAWPRQHTRDAWRRTLTIKRGAGSHRRYNDLHRASGIWLLAFLLLMGVTGAYLCFPKQGRALVSKALTTLPADMRTATPVAPRQVDPDALVRHAQSLWPDTQWTRLQIPADATSTYDVRLLQHDELRADTGDTRVRMSAANRVVDVRNPLRAPAGDRLLGWLFPLHSGEALGIVGRFAWTAFGLLPMLLFVTGLWLWWTRRRQPVERQRR